MLVEALNQISKRIPPARGLFKNLSLLSPEFVFNKTKKGEASDLPFQHLVTAAVEEQYRKVSFVDWKQEQQFCDGIPLESAEFWLGVLKHFSFKELSTYALTCLTTPVMQW